MVNSKTLVSEFERSLTLDIPVEEKNAIARLVIEHVLNADPQALMQNVLLQPTSTQQDQLDSLIKRLNRHEPVQYVINEAWFYGRPFYVDHRVLIPRPETEELVQHVLTRTGQKRVLDIGTGSGCIPVTVALENAMAEVFALDVSGDALAVARRNADAYNATVVFFEHDLFQGALPVAGLDIIVSNPPYITREEAGTMEKNVLDFEPHLALFVDNQDPLLYYHALAAKAFPSLRSDGWLMVEINARFGSEVEKAFLMAGYTNTDVKKDINGKDRMVVARKP
jgi:release factor glutamine methyltransferase